MKPFFTLIVLFLSFQIYAQELTVMTYNIRLDTEQDGVNQWKNRKDFLCGQLAFYDPMVFGVQEALPNQMRDLQDALPAYRYVGVGREDGKESGEFSAIFYKRDDVELLDSDTFWLSQTPNKVSVGWDAALPRICTWAKFRIRHSNRELLVMNTHFDHVGTEARQKSIDLIIKQSKALNPNNAPVIVMGDLNLEPHSAAIKNLQGQLEDSRLIAGASAFGPEGTFNGWQVDKPVERRIDYIFLSFNDFILDKYAVLSDFINGHYASDHLPVWIQIELTNERNKIN